MIEMYACSATGRFRPEGFDIEDHIRASQLDNRLNSYCRAAAPPPCGTWRGTFAPPSVIANTGHGAR